MCPLHADASVQLNCNKIVAYVKLRQCAPDPMENTTKIGNETYLLVPHSTARDPGLTADVSSPPAAQPGRGQPG